MGGCGFQQGGRGRQGGRKSEGEENEVKASKGERMRENVGREGEREKEYEVKDGRDEKMKEIGEKGSK